MGQESQLSDNLQELEERHQRMGQLLWSAWQAHKRGQSLDPQLQREAAALCDWAKEVAQAHELSDAALARDVAAFTGALRLEGDAMLARQLWQTARELETVLDKA